VARILYVTNTRSRFIDIDRALLAEQHDVRELFCRPGRVDPLEVARGVRWADAIVGWFAAWHMVLPLVLARAFRKPSLLIVGGFDVAALPGIDYGDQRPGIRRPVGRWVMGSATRLMTNSAFSRDEAAANTGIPAARFEVVHHGLPDPFGTLPAGGARAGALTVGAVVRSNLHRKGHEAFVRAAAELPDVEFTLVGPWGDDAVDQLRAMATPNVTFTGRIDDAALLDRYRTASVYVQPSRHEGFGMSVAEAMLGGCIPVVTRAGALPEVVGDAGVYAHAPAPPAVASAVRTALAADDAARRAARERVLERFTLARRREGLLDLLEGVLAGGQGQRPGGEADVSAPRVSEGAT
jgi:glycosyltransferase involved in cell wall biosynthesis